jgi:hypothetical protein
VLSAQLTTAPTGRASDIRNLFPADPPLPAIHSPFPISSLFSNPLAYCKKPKNGEHRNWLFIFKTPKRAQAGLQRALKTDRRNFVEGNSKKPPRRI